MRSISSLVSGKCGCLTRSLRFPRRPCSEPICHASRYLARSRSCALAPWRVHEFLRYACLCVSPSCPLVAPCFFSESVDGAHTGATFSSFKELQEILVAICTLLSFRLTTNFRSSSTQSTRLAAAPIAKNSVIAIGVVWKSRLSGGQ